MTFERTVCELVAFLTSELIERKPIDPIEHLLNVLDFPLAGSSSIHHDPSVCENCRGDNGCSSSFYHNCCCEYELMDPFQQDSCQGGRLSRFLNSKETVLVIVGDVDVATSKHSLCDCFGTGKSRLCNWLDFPGQFIHKRRVIRASGESISSLMEYLEREPHMRFTNKLSHLDLEAPQPTLTLIDEIEPPHRVLHGLLQHDYFRAEKIFECSKCNRRTEAALHKSIIFTRPGVFFKFPVPCPISVIVRRSAQTKKNDRRQSTNQFLSFTSLVGPAHGTSKRHFTAISSVPASLPEISSVAQRECFREDPALIKEDRLMQILQEIAAEFSIKGDQTQPLTLSRSATFRRSILSRCRTEALLAELIVRRMIEPNEFDFSEFPDMVLNMVNAPRVDLYFGFFLQRILHRMRRKHHVNRLEVGNLLCLAVASQQSCSPFVLSSTATEMLRLYLESLDDSSESSDFLWRADSSVYGSVAAVQRINLQNIIVDSVDGFKKSQMLVTCNVLDVRGALIGYDLLGTLVESAFRSMRSSGRTPSSPDSESVGDEVKSKWLPLLLLSDVTDVGRHGYEGVTAKPELKVVLPHALFCFIAHVDDEGMWLVITVEKNKVTARQTFGGQNDADFVWHIRLTQSRGVVHAAMLRQRSFDQLALLLVDGSVCLVSFTQLKRGTSVSIEALLDEDTQVRFVRPPPSDPPTFHRRDRENISLTLQATSTHQSFIRHESRVSFQTPVSVTSEEKSDTDLQHCVTFVDHHHLGCEDPSFVVASEQWIAAASHDSDLMCVVPRTSATSRTVVQAESNIVSACFLDEVYLVLGLDTGAVQLFEIPSGSEVLLFEHHEAQVNVVRPIPASTDDIASEMFIVGSEDSTMSLFCVQDTDPLRSIRVHGAPIIDIIASHVVSNRVVLSADRGGNVMVVSMDRSALSQSGNLLWSSNIFGLRCMSLSRDGSWLTVSRSQNSPLAIPISEWSRSGTGQFHQKAISALHITADEMFLLTGGDDGLIFVWDLLHSFKYVSCFQQHNMNSSINSISSSHDGSRIVSADCSNLIYLWLRSSCSVIRILMRSQGGGFARFLENDFLMVQSSRGIKIFDADEKLCCSTTVGDHRTAVDAFLAPEELYNSGAFKSQEPKAKVPSRRSGFSSSESSSDDDNQQVEEESPVEEDQCELDPDELLKRRFFVGIARGNVDSGRHFVSIFSLEDMETPKFELVSGDVEDDFGDEEDVRHTDRITAFKFLPHRPAFKPTADPDEAPPPPTILLAATGAEDLTVILWHWRKQQPLKLLQHTNFVTGCAFCFPTIGPRTSYDAKALRRISKIDPSFQKARDGSLVCYLVTSQYANESDPVSLRVFEVRENNRAFQKRLLGLRCGQATDALTFPYNMLTVETLSMSKVPVERGSSLSGISSVRCIAIRGSDGLICTGDETCQVVFWRLLSSRPPLSKISVDIDEQSDHDDDDMDDGSMAQGAAVQLWPLRRLASRI